MRQFMLGAVLVLAIGSVARAGQVVNGAAILKDSSPPTNAVTVSPGGSFPLILEFDATITPFTTINYFLEDTSFTGTAHFQITGRTRLGTNPLPTPITLDTALVGDPIDDKTLDLGYTGATVSNTGNYDLETLTIRVLPGTPNGVYILHADPATTYNAPGVTTIDFLGSYTVTVVPEPAAVALVGLGAALALVRRRRR